MAIYADCKRCGELLASYVNDTEDRPVWVHTVSDPEPHDPEPIRQRPRQEEDDE